MLLRLWREDEGVLTFEWILLLTLLVIGVIGGVAGIRDALLAEAQNVVGAIASVNQTYTVAPPLGVSVSNGFGVAACSGAQGFGFEGTNMYNVFRQSVTTTANLGSASCGL
jgi:Flp pilus assembly pilin Flp